ncbi:hypothetical protein [Rossellomorea vietnamensis]|uniref:hypothetical protein n=1 Tax=Rossellomorea vietnamensis TaxID=218284 RepID=UPI003CEE2FC4
MRLLLWKSCYQRYWRSYQRNHLSYRRNGSSINDFRTPIDENLHSINEPQLLNEPLKDQTIVCPPAELGLLTASCWKEAEAVTGE